MELRISKEEVRGEAIIMPFQKKVYTIADIEALPEGERAELINGELYMMASPTRTHQEISVEMLFQIKSFINMHKGRCKVYHAPFAVYLHNDDKTYLEPDIVVVCDEDKLDEKGCHGAPDWVVEIVSSSSHRMDYVLKLAEYRKAGVREYWLVDSKEQMITVYQFGEEEKVEKYSLTDRVKVGLYEDLEIWLEN